jgi:hypothetical protein
MTSSTLASLFSAFAARVLALLWPKRHEARSSALRARKARCLEAASGYLRGRPMRVIYVARRKSVNGERDLENESRSKIEGGGTAAEQWKRTGAVAA